MSWKENDDQETRRCLSLSPLSLEKKNVRKKNRKKLTALIFEPYSAASSSMSGAIIRQGPHQGAQKSTSTGTDDLRTFSSQVASVTGPDDEERRRDWGSRRR